MNLPHQVKLKRPISASMHMINAWCDTHVGVYHNDWARNIVHMSYDPPEYTWRYSFNSAEHATSFALLWC
jgi:hypothetical protein